MSRIQSDMVTEARPSNVNFFGISYKVTYVDTPSEVDPCKRIPLWGQINYWARTIRIYSGKRQTEEIWSTLWHEILHAIALDLGLTALCDEGNHNELTLLALAITNVLFRNGWITVEEVETLHEQEGDALMNE